MKLTIIGLGLIGGSIAKDLRKNGFASQITGVENNTGNAAQALSLGLVDKIATLDESLKNADMVLICVPVDVITVLLPEILDSVDEHTTVVDVGSTKRKLVDGIKNHPRRRNYVPVHPMAGTEDSGPTAAIEGLFKEKIAIICDQNESAPQHLALVEKMFHALGMNIAYMTADEQDHTTAFVSHLPHAVAFALANAVQDKADRKIIFDLASGGFNSTVRLAKSAKSMWLPIFEQNKDYLAESLNVYMKHLELFREALLKENDKELEALIDNANQIRKVLDPANRQLVKNEETIIKFYTKN